MVFRTSLGVCLCLALLACDKSEPDDPPKPQPSPTGAQTSEAEPEASTEQPDEPDEQPKPVAADDKPQPPDTAAPPKDTCDQKALAELAGKIEKEQSRETVNLLAKGLVKACGDQLVPTVAHYLEAHGMRPEEAGFAPFKDERFDALKQKTCIGHGSLTAKLKEASPGTLGSVAYDVCEYGRFDLMTREQAGEMNSLGWFTWTTHQLLLDQGTPVEVAKTLSRTMVTFELANFAPQLIIPLAGQELPTVDHGRTIRTGTPIYLSTSEAQFNERKIATLEKGFFSRNEIKDKTPFADERLITAIQDELSMEAEISGSTRLIIAADRRLLFGAALDTMYSATKAGFTEFDLIVESPWPIKRALPVKYSAPYSDFEGLTIQVEPDGFALRRPGSSKREFIKKKGDDRMDMSWEAFDAKALSAAVKKWRKSNPETEAVRIRSGDGMALELAVRTHSLLMDEDCDDDGECWLGAVTLERL